ncbi:hypothetical protein TWF696_004658 [Orbilia brochopaga]|uniref:Uncharacterized protein n=1 Tax=Orbilia brochopaga TaxID=3140254 RepID=A0AAV9VAM9_9PEZI
MIMTSLQNFINRRASSRNSAVARAESPVKQQSAFGSATSGASHIPLAASRVPSRSTNHSRPELRDDSDDFKDSEILSLENQDGDGYDDEDDEELASQNGNGGGGNFLHDFDRDEVGGRYLVNNGGHKNGVVTNGQGYTNGNVNGNGGEAYRWQNNLPPSHEEDDDSDEESDGRLTPKIRIAADEQLAERSRTPPGRRDADLASEQLQQEQFYTSLEFEDPAGDNSRPSTGDSIDEARPDINGAKGSQSWEEIDREYAQQNKTPATPVRFSVSGLFEVLKGMGMMLRGSERLVLTDHLANYKHFSIVNPSLPYQILIPYNHSHPLEPTKMLSEIATIAFIRRNCPSLPTPEIAYHNLDVTNAAKVPFLVIRALKGRAIASLDGGVPAALKDRKRCAALLDGLAKVQSQIMKATASNSLTVDRIGNILFKTDAKKPKQSFVVGPCLAADDDAGTDVDSSVPITDLADLCLQVFQATESSSLTATAVPVNPKELRSAKRRLAGLLGLLPSLPQQYAELTLFHNSLSLSSILIDPATSAITCVLGFRDVYAVPMALTPVYPAEIRPANAEWTLWIGGDGGMDKHWGLRSIYETRMAKYNARFAGDIWDDEELGGWLQVWEVVNGGVEVWVKKRAWIEAELERLRKQ